MTRSHCTPLNAVTRRGFTEALFAAAAAPFVRGSARGLPNFVLIYTDDVTTQVASRPGCHLREAGKWVGCCL